MNVLDVSQLARSRDIMGESSAAKVTQKIETYCAVPSTPDAFVRTRSKNMRVRGGEGLGKLRNIQNVHSEESIP